MEDEMVNSQTDLFAVGYVVACLEKREAIVLRPFHQSTCFYLFGQILDLLQLWHVGILKYFPIMFHFDKVIQSSQRRTNRLLSPLQICLTPMTIRMDLRNSSKLLLRSLLRLVSRRRFRQPRSLYADIL